MLCPLCRTDGLESFLTLGARRLLRCPVCRLISVHPDDRPDPDVERARYLRHENDPTDEGYRSFLMRLVEPVAARLPSGARGLDYGAGKSGAVARLFAERGFEVEGYDPYFAPDSALLDRTWDFIVCCETAEHFFEPGREFERMGGLLRSGGILGLMTQLVESEEGFADWWYARDVTHVSFYHLTTLHWIADRFDWVPEILPAGVTLFTRP